jgi:hypothetical protein
MRRPKTKPITPRKAKSGAVSPAASGPAGSHFEAQIGAHYLSGIRRRIQRAFLKMRLQVDRQTKASYATYEAAEKAELGIKKEHPILQAAVYDGVESVNKIIELP